MDMVGESSLEAVLADMEPGEYLAVALAAIDKGDLDRLARVIRWGLPVDDDNGHLLFYATQAQNVKAVELLLELGADPLLDSSVALREAFEGGCKVIAELLSKACVRALQLQGEALPSIEYAMGNVCECIDGEPEDNQPLFINDLLADMRWFYRIGTSRASDLMSLVTDTMQARVILECLPVTPVELLPMTKRQDIRAFLTRLMFKAAGNNPLKPA